MNVLLHCVNACLLMALAERLLARPGILAAVRIRAAAVGCAGSLLWALHPLGTAAVTYVVQRAESLGALMMIATVLAWLSGVLDAPRPGITRLLQVACLSALAGTAKETAVAIPIVTLLIDRALVAGSWRATMRHWQWHAAAAASWPSIAVMITALGGRGSSAGFDSASPWLYLLTQSQAIWLYLARITWPHTFVFDYGYLLSSGLTESWPWLAATSGLFVAVCCGFAKRPAAFLGPLLFFVLLAPTSSIIPVKTQTIAEHRAYLASAALIIPAVAAGWLVASRQPRLSPRMAVAAVGLLAVALGIRTAFRNHDFLTPERLWRTSLTAEPRNTRAMINLSTLLIRKEDEASLAEAERLLAAVARSGRFPRALTVNQGMLHATRREYAAALTSFDRALTLTPDAAELLADRGFALWKLGRLEAAIESFDRSIQSDAGNPRTWLNRGNVAYDLGRPDEAESDFSRAVRIDPEYAKGWGHLGFARHERGDRDGAAQAFDRAVACAPRDAEARYNRANFRAEAGDDSKALDDFTEAILIEPGFRDAYYNRAMVLLRTGDVSRARADIEAFRRLGGEVQRQLLDAAGLTTDR